MIQTVCYGLPPPLYDTILAAFPLAAQSGVYFSWGSVIYYPRPTMSIPPEIQAHEAVHGERQLACGIETWWQRYIEDKQFRFDEELPAHRAEYRRFCELNTKGNARNRRRLVLHHIAARLASPLYGSMISYEKARGLIKR